MAAPRGRPRYQTPAKRAVRGRTKGRGALAGKPRRAARLERAFVLLVVPVLLMLGSVYVHTVATGLEVEAARLEEEKVGAESEGERLEVRITELSEPGRIRTSAREDLRMRDPGKDLETYGSEGEDATDGGEKKREETGG